MSYLRYMCLFANSGVQHILCCDFLSSSCVPCHVIFHILVAILYDV
jgi:hypothetical protein